ncbi:MAG TPA: disulfide bond formation protein B [Gammaproteobacteria bacterium]|nr:disulfide bond formation protein B [Gammaproteobacteria bacterium]
MKPPRNFYLAVALLCGGLLSFGYYLQFHKGIEPCPLCIFQRIAFISIIIIALAGLLHGPVNFMLRVYSGLIGVAALIGGGIAAWQVRLIHLPPDEIPACSPGLDYMLEVFPLTETIRMAFTGSGECAEVTWTFLSFSIPEWSLLWFTLLTIAALTHGMHKRLYGRF